MNCRQAIVFLLPSMGLTEIEHSFAASPMIFWPLALTFTWKLVKEANREIIRGEVSMMRGAAGGLSYTSSGTLRGTLSVGANWLEARGTNNSDSRQAERAVFKWIIIRNSLDKRFRDYKKATTTVKVKPRQFVHYAGREQPLTRASWPNNRTRDKGSLQFRGGSDGLHVCLAADYSLRHAGLMAIEIIPAEELSLSEQAAIFTEAFAGYVGIRSRSARRGWRVFFAGKALIFAIVDSLVSEEMFVGLPISITR